MEFSKEQLKKMRVAAAKKLAQRDRQIVMNTFEYAKESLLMEFLNHPVTKEIQAGPDSSSSDSDVLSDIAPVGNLFSFIGFNRGEDPISPILERLKLITLDFKVNGEFISIKIRNYPVPQDIWNITPMPRQTGRSWARGIESGISGLNYFLFLKEKTFKVSASGHAIQLKEHKMLEGTRFRNTRYITNLLNKYKSAFNRLYRFDYGITAVFE